MTGLSDEELALGIQHGRSEHLDLLVERHHGALLGFLYRMTGGDRPLAEDLLQETFLRLLAGIHTYRYPRPVKPWLYAVALNLVRDHFRRAEIRRTDSWKGGLDPAAPGDAETQLLSAERGWAIAAAIRGMPPLQREAIILRYFQELSLKEIAEVLQAPLGTVKSRLSLGLRRLKSALE